MWRWCKVLTDNITTHSQQYKKSIPKGKAVLILWWKMAFVLNWAPEVHYESWVQDAFEVKFTETGCPHVKADET